MNNKMDGLREEDIKQNVRGKEDGRNTVELME